MRKILERALKTFIEAFTGSLVVMLPNADLRDKSVLYGLIISSLATGISAILNLALNYIDNVKINKKGE